MTTPTPVELVTVERRGDALISTVNAKMLEDKALKALAAVLDQATQESGINRVVINLERVQLVPSLGLGLLIRISQKCASRDQTMLLAGMSAQVRQTFTLTKLDRVLQLADNVDAALAT